MNEVPSTVNVVCSDEEGESARDTTTVQSLPIQENNRIQWRSFWRAGTYNVIPKPVCPVKGQLEHARVHPKFLHSNATSHRWALGAIAELLDNAVDEICNGATFVKIDKFRNKKDNDPALLFQDDGGGMDPEGLRNCMSLGYSSKNKKTTIGQYGNGFKTSTMRLGADVIVFSRAIRQSGTTQSIGLLSYTFLRTTGQDDIIVPMVDFQISEKHAKPILFTSESDWKSNLQTIIEWSPFSSETELMLQFEDLGSHGTKILVYNLWLNDDGLSELDFDDDDEDIRLRGEYNCASLPRAHKKEVSSHISHAIRYSLRAYASVLYLRRFVKFRIILRGKPIEQHSIAEELKFSEVIKYKPQLVKESKEVTVETTIGFIKEAPVLNISGFNIYHKNRLIMPFWKVFHEASSRGKCVVGILEANFIEPAHDKQDFEKTAPFIRLEVRLKQMTLDYWKSHCHLIGFQSPHSRMCTLEKEHSLNQPIIECGTEFRSNHENRFPAYSRMEPGSGNQITGLATIDANVSSTNAPSRNLLHARVMQFGQSGKQIDVMLQNETNILDHTNVAFGDSRVGDTMATTSGQGLTLIDKICEENIQLFMRSEENRQKEEELHQMIEKLENELKETKRKCSELALDLEIRKRAQIRPN